MLKKIEMRRVIFTLVLTVITSCIFAQVEKPVYKTVADQFERAYNQSNYDSIFAMFSVDMQKTLPITAKAMNLIFYSIQIFHFLQPYSKATNFFNISL
jgi:hypothetical protein